MNKIFVLDTNVLIHDPEAFLHFDDNEVVLPITVIEELDKLKRGNGEIPYSSRQTLRLIDGFRALGKLSAGVALPNGGMLRVVLDKDELHLSKPTNDNMIISTAVSLAYAESNPKPVILVSKDTSVRIKADALGLVTQDYMRDKTTVFEKYGSLMQEEDNDKIEDEDRIKSVRYMQAGDKIFRLYGEDNMELIRRQRSVMSISPKNIDQECAIDALLAPQINVIALTGRAGTGKTLLALAAGLHFCTKPPQKEKDHKKRYEQVVVARPIVPLGNDLGFLPGDVSEKLHPWMEPIYDNLDVIVGTSDEQVDGKDTDYRSSDYLVESDLIHIEPLTYIRGRSLPNRYLIIDEAQNLRPLDVKTIITRCGEGTKV
ncbi:PhoH family protein, partial [bacterium]|nr:PhoH family protein [bacterium]